MKKSIIAVLAVTMILGTQLEADASVVFDSIDGDLSYEEVGAEVYLTAEEQEWNSIKDEWVRETEARFYERSSQGINVSLVMEHVNQKNGYYCGPATVKQTLCYFGKRLTQDECARQLKTTTAGTIMSNIPGVINANVSLTPGYSMRSIGTKSNYTAEIYTALSRNRPVIIDIKTEDSDNWPYETTGHFLNVAGIRSNATENRMMVVDPYASETENWYTTDLVYKVNSKNPNRAFIW